MQNYNAKDVDSYIASADKEARSILKEIREIIKSTIPEVEEGISWGVPFYKYHGQIGGFAAYKHHVSFGFGADVLQSEERKMFEEKGYKTGKGTIQIKFDQKVPARAIKQLLKAKVKIKMNPQVDEYLSKVEKWQLEMEKLRMIILDCQLTEELKWGKPCYTFQKSNIVIIQGFKEYCALLFFKGAMLNDANGILIKPGENTQAGRQIRFINVQEIGEMEPILKAYIYEAIELEKAGLKINFKKTTEYKVPEEFQNKLDEIPALKTAFDTLTPGRQRAYLLYFSLPKKSKTRVSRVEKSIEQILNGKGLND